MMAGLRVVDGRGGGRAGRGGGHVGQVGRDGNDDPARGRDRSNGGSGGGRRGGRGYAEDPIEDLMDDDNDAAGVMIIARSRTSNATITRRNRATVIRKSKLAITRSDRLSSLIYTEDVVIQPAYLAIYHLLRSSTG
ncbi:hypothetical protein DCAR_0311777 [Daucus carota subsp. sativus]|nr:hypothetical protein DCAR_0311777 [Daucus carota subsp. sativus]